MTETNSIPFIIAAQNVIDELTQRDAVITSLQSQLADAQNQIGTLNGQITSMQQQIDGDNYTMAQLNSEKNDAAAAFQSQIDSLNQQLADANATIQRLQNP